MHKSLAGLKVHLVGIGGIGISGIARYLLSQGVQVSGSDIVCNAMVTKLQSMGVKISIPHTTTAIKDQDLIIHSAIIQEDNIEIQESRRREIPILSRREALKFILGQKKVISVCGAHGKSSTSAMLASIFPNYSAIIGAECKEFGSNVRDVMSEGLVFEADESDRSFLNSNPHYAVVTNAEAEHMESYNFSLRELEDCYERFLNSATKACINISDPFLLSLHKKSPNKYIALDPERDIKDVEFFLRNDEPFCRFSLRDFGVFEVWGFGYHTAMNAAAAILLSSSILPIETIRENLKNFCGIKKRFDIIQKSRLTLIDDYAHHPTEIKVTLDAARIYAKFKGIHKITAIWQPHKFSRLRDNLEGFRNCFTECDELVILPVFSAGERRMDFDMPRLFAQYKPIFATHIQREGERLLFMDTHRVVGVLDCGIGIGLGAGDITYQIRGE